MRGQLHKELEFWMIVEKQLTVQEKLAQLFNKEPLIKNGKLI